MNLMDFAPPFLPELKKTAHGGFGAAIIRFWGFSLPGIFTECIPGTHGDSVIRP